MNTPSGSTNQTVVVVLYEDVVAPANVRSLPAAR